jgi:diguanylate cyclase (GGDEF)-like protein
MTRAGTLPVMRSYAVGERLSSAVRVYDSVGRYGGEEFLILAPGGTPPELVSQAERMRTTVAAEPFRTSAGEVALTASFGVLGVSLAEGDTVDQEALLRAADDALYQAKAKGRNRVEMGLAALAGARK